MDTTTATGKSAPKNDYVEITEKGFLTYMERYLNIALTAEDKQARGTINALRVAVSNRLDRL